MQVSLGTHRILKAELLDGQITCNIGMAQGNPPDVKAIHTSGLTQHSRKTLQASSIVWLASPRPGPAH